MDCQSRQNYPGRQTRAPSVRFHPLALFGVAAVLVFYSWDLQKEKASRRFRTLLGPKGVANYLTEESKLPAKDKNYIYDRWAAVIIGGAAFLEIIIRLCEHGL